MDTSPMTQNVSFLIGKECHQLALGLYEFQILLNGTRISIQQTLALQVSNGPVIFIDAEKPVESKDLFLLLGKKIVEARLDSAKTLEICFEGDVKITIPPSSNNVESYQLTNKDIYIAA